MTALQRAQRDRDFERDYEYMQLVVNGLIESIEDRDDEAVDKMKQFAKNIYDDRKDTANFMLPRFADSAPLSGSEQVQYMMAKKLVGVWSFVRRLMMRIYEGQTSQVNRGGLAFLEEELEKQPRREDNLILRTAQRLAPLVDSYALMGPRAASGEPPESDVTRAAERARDYAAGVIRAMGPQITYDAEAMAAAAAATETADAAAAAAAERAREANLERR
jgi:hypothetical protein